jgi:hypothetical protein
MTLTQLVAGKTYYLRATSVSAKGSTATTGVARFVAMAPSVGDTTVTDFRTGTRSGGVVVRATGDGIVALAGGARTGTFTSRVLTAEQRIAWDRISWRATVPAGASITVMVRSGNAPKPDATWSGWVRVAVSGTALPLLLPQSRYLQYRVDMTASASGASPGLDALNVTHNGWDPVAAELTESVPRPAVRARLSAAVIGAAR